MATIESAFENVQPTAGPGKEINPKPAPFQDATNKAAPVVRTHTQFDEEGNPCEVIKTEVDKPDVAASPPLEDHPSESDEGITAVNEDELQEAGADEVEEAEAVDGQEESAAKKAYRDVPSLFNTEKERTAKWEGTHIRFPEDDDADDEHPAASVSEEMQANIDMLSSAVSSAMVVDSAK